MAIHPVSVTSKHTANPLPFQAGASRNCNGALYFESPAALSLSHSFVSF